jgi:hypothetical protein
MFRTLSDRTTTEYISKDSKYRMTNGPTLIFTDVFERKGQARVLSLHNADLSKRTLPNNAEQFEVVEVHCEKYTSQ